MLTDSILLFYPYMPRCGYPSFAESMTSFLPSLHIKRSDPICCFQVAWQRMRFDQDEIANSFNP